MYQLSDTLSFFHARKAVSCMNYLTPDEAKQKIVDTVAALQVGTVIDRHVSGIYAGHIVQYLLEYCHRRDFPEALVLTAAQLVLKWTASSDGGMVSNAPLKSIKQDDTEFQFAVNSVSAAGVAIDDDLAALQPKLNVYRKVRWPACSCHTDSAGQP